MAAPKRHRQFVFVLVPEEGVAEAAAHRTASAVCRIALLADLTPICPALMYVPFMTPEERSTKLPLVARQWLKRCDKIWLQFPSTKPALDAFSFRVLQNNEGSAVRRTVYQLERADESIYPVPMSREELKFLLGCNLDVGLARCA